jgi:hypothetical protein
MQQAVFTRIASTLPQVQPQVVKANEEERKQVATAAQKSAGAKSVAKPVRSAPVVNETTFGRNDLVVIEKDGETQKLKFKKAEPLLAQGWTLEEK